MEIRLFLDAIGKYLQSEIPESPSIARKGLCALPKAFYLAQKMGEKLGCC